MVVDHLLASLLYKLCVSLHNKFLGFALKTEGVLQCMSKWDHPWYVCLLQSMGKLLTAFTCPMIVIIRGAQSPFQQLSHRSSVNAPLSCMLIFDSPPLPLPPPPQKSIAAKVQTLHFIHIYIHFTMIINSTKLICHNRGWFMLGVHAWWNA